MPHVAKVNWFNEIVYTRARTHTHALLPLPTQLRFPILLALNKADMDASAAHIRRIRAALPHEPAVAVSAASERWLCTQRRAGKVAYPVIMCVGAMGRGWGGT